MTRAAIYVRVSTARQAERDLSIPDQIVQYRTWRQRQDIEVVQVFSEPGASVLDEGRPVFQEMIHTAKRADKPFDLVIVHSLSRFSRDSLHSELYILHSRVEKSRRGIGLHHAGGRSGPDRRDVPQAAAHFRRTSVP